MSPRLSLFIILSQSSVLIQATSVSAATPERSHRLIVSLDIPGNEAPEYLCIISVSRVCKPGSETKDNTLIKETDCLTSELSDLQELGSLPKDLSTGDVAISAPREKTLKRPYNKSEETVQFDAALWGALQSLSRGKKPGCDEMHEGCTPRVRLSAYASNAQQQHRPTSGSVDPSRARSESGQAQTPGGRIVCGKDPSARNDRVAILDLSYHIGESGSGVQEIQLQGTSATLFLQREVPSANFAFAQVLGGDYVFSPVAAIGTNERITVTLHPRCALFGAELPMRSSAVPFDEARFYLDTWGSEAAGLLKHAVADDRPATRHSTALAAGAPRNDPIFMCKPKLKQTTLPINIPYINDAGTKRLVVTPSPDTGHGAVSLEASWNGPLPQGSLRLAHRTFEFSWRRDCLAGEWLPMGKRSSDPSWNGMCPRATIDGLLKCPIVEQGNPSICQYRCTVEDSIPALSLPATVKFDRIIVRNDDDKEQLLYGWHDTVAFSGQELSSFVAPNDRSVVVEIRAPQVWRSKRGNEIEEIEIRHESSERPQIIPIGNAPPSWTTIAAPNATCVSRFTVDVVGARAFAERDLNLEPNGNLVLTTPSAYRDLLHLVFTIGGGALMPRSEPGAKFRGEPYASIGLGGELYISRLFSAIELNIIYEPSFAGYGAIPRPPTAVKYEREPSVPYHRGMLELAASHWGNNRSWQLGLMIGAGAGGPMFGEIDKVGAFHKFYFGGALVRLNPFSLSLHASIELNLGVRYGEHHEYFGRDDDGTPSNNRFHGEPVPYAPSLLQKYAGLRWRIAFR